MIEIKRCGMETVINEEDHLTSQNAKTDDYKNRYTSSNREVRVEARIEKLESKMGVVNSELQLLGKTMRDVADTLKEIKDDQKKIQQFEVDKALLRRDLEEQYKLIELLSKKLDVHGETINQINVKGAGNDVKIGFSERFMWAVVTAIVAWVGWFKNG